MTSPLSDDLYPSRQGGDPTIIDRQDPVVYGRPDDGPLGAEQMSAYDTQGFLLLDEVLPEGEVATLRDELERLRHDPALKDIPERISEPKSGAMRSLFRVHELSEVFAGLVADKRIVGLAEQLLGSRVYLHQTRVNDKPGLSGEGFYWHSDFETWHAEDGLPRMRTCSISLALTENTAINGPLMLIPGSHRRFVVCPAPTPDEHHKASLIDQQVGTPDPESLKALVESGGITTALGGPGSAVIFDSNTMHGSAGNITPFGRSNVFMVFNSVDNAAVAPFGAKRPRPEFLGSRQVKPL